MLRERLAGKRVLLTGVTGFVGEALLARLLADLPEVAVSVLIRPKPGQSGRDRLHQLVGKAAFAGWAGGGDRLAVLDARVAVLEGELAALPPLPADVDVVIHCAGDVSFDPPIDEGFATNVSGTEALLRALADAGARPHYVHVSTAYVSGRRRGAVPEASLDHEVDWREETAAAGRLRTAIEDASRSPSRLAALHKQAERDHRRSGPITTATDAERLRRNWVRERLVAAGGERARSLGWTDVYTFTKALGERAVEELTGEWPVSIVRPSIIESALERPYPGWIEGFKMAEPIILAYGRGELPEFPAAPDAIADIVPVDHVVGALLAVAAHPPEPGGRAYYHVSSGARNPLTFRHLHDHVRTYFEAHPFEQPGRGAARLPTWRWPGGDSVERVLRSSERAHAAADSVVSRLPRSTRVREAARSLDRQKQRLEFLRRYHDLYRPYVETELVFTDDRTLALHNSLEPEDRAAFGFDTAAVDWPRYIVDVHCPSVAGSMRAMMSSRPARPAAVARGLPAGGEILAAFDMDGTLLSSNVVESYLWLRFGELNGARRLDELRSLATRLPGYLRAERRDRGAFLRAVYRRYAGAALAELDNLVDEVVADLVLSRVSPTALRRVREHRAAGHRTVLITGAIRPLTRPLQPLFDDVVAADLSLDAGGRATGFLASPPLVGEGRAAWLRRYASIERLDLAASYAYADSHSDLPMLRAVGHPVAVNPDVALYRAARRGRWPIEDWRTGAARIAAQPVAAHPRAGVR
ncbi:MAG TPA: HAD-IB family hydrolase [Mycobacteriales bacterium]|nr:HAD-IB family hydrolase [Mycobacteriales bacterium]